MRQEWQCPAWPSTVFLGWAKGHAVSFRSLRKLGLETPQTAFPSKVQAWLPAEMGPQEGLREIRAGGRRKQLGEVSLSGVPSWRVESGSPSVLLPAVCVGCISKGGLHHAGLRLASASLGCPRTPALPGRLRCPLIPSNLHTLPGPSSPVLGPANLSS